MRLSEFRSGTFEQRLAYRSFSPEPINHPWIIDDPQVLSLLGEADRAVGELNAFAQLVPDIAFFISMYVAKEATQSSRIEGTQTSIEDAFKGPEDLAPEARDDWSEVQNYIAAINFAIDALDQFPLSNRLLRDTHAILMRGVRGATKQPGQFRVSQNWIGVTLKNAAFVPPHHEHVPELMSDLEKFLHNEAHFVPPLIKIAIAHYQFETIHPFLDGNGRLGRLMISLYLASEGLMVRPALYLSDFFERNKTAYVDNLMAVRAGNHMRDWMIFFLEGIKQTARDAIGVFRAILALKEHVERTVLPKLGARRQPHGVRLVQALYARPIIDVRRASELLDVAPNTASSLIRLLCQHGVLQEMTGRQRSRFYVFRDYLSLFR